MSKKLYDCIEITDLKDMLNKTRNIYADRPAYKIRAGEGKYKTFTHSEVRDMIDSLGTALCDLGLKGKRIAVIGENRYEWEIAYLSIVCGTGIVVPVDKALPENELKSVIERSEVEAIFYSEKYSESIEKIQKYKENKLKHLISMDLDKHTNGVYSQNELIETGRKLIKEGNREFLDAKINREEMSIMLFTSGTTSMSKIVALSHKNLACNLMDTASVLDVNSEDVVLSNLPLHHVFECTVGFLFSLYKGAGTVFSDGVKHIIDNLNEYKVTVMACVPGIYEIMYGLIKKQLEKQGRLQEFLENPDKYRALSMEERKQEFKEIHDMFGGRVKIFICGAAALEPSVHENFKLLGFNMTQGYGLTETSPVVTIETPKYNRAGSVGKTIPNVEAKLVDVNSEGMGELIVKGPNIMLGYYGNEEATKEAIKDGWFYTGDLAKIDEDGYVYICGRKKSVIVLKNGKNIFPEEMEGLVNKIEGVKESLIFGKQASEDKDDIKINVEIVFDRERVEEVYKVKTDEEIYEALQGKIKEINEIMPKYKAIRGIILTETPLIKTTTNKIKRQANIDAIEKLKN